MVRIVISIVLLVALCVLVVLNLDHTTPLNIFWITLDRVSIVAVGLVSFVCGVLYSFFLYVSRYVVGLRIKTMANRRRDLDQREKETITGETPAPPLLAKDPDVSAAATVEQAPATKPSPKQNHRSKRRARGR